MNHAHAIAFALGFISLSQEILWTRLIGFAHGSVPQAFAFVLCFFLLGIAFGAAIGERLCRAPERLYDWCAVLLVGAGILDATLPYGVAWVVSIVPGDGLGNPLAEFGTRLFEGGAVLLTAMLKSALFPIVHQLGSLGPRATIGRSMSRVYFSNIAGSTLGPIVTGFFLLNVMSVETAFGLMSAATFALAAACGLRSSSQAGRSMVACAIGAPLACVVPVMTDHAMVSRLAGGGLKNVVQNRQGIIHVRSGGAAGDQIFGGNTYDGHFNIDLRQNDNGIHRAYFAATFHPAPRRVLVVGLSSGSWAKVIASFPGVERMDIVEINPGYVELVGRSPVVADLLGDSRVHVHIDDGRRWLRRRSMSDRYDLIVMNTTQHWKNNATGLLSRDFLAEVKRHLHPDGVLYYNATGSVDVLRTAGEVFREAYLYSTFVAATDVDLRRRIGELGERPHELVWRGRALLPRDDPSIVAAVGQMHAEPLLSLQEVAARWERPLEVVSDQNMITEYKYGRGF